MSGGSSSGRKRRLEEGLEKIQRRAVEEAAKPVPPSPDEVPENPDYPCPADGQTLYAWTSQKRFNGGDPVMLDQCEECRLAVSRAPAAPEAPAELAALERRGDDLIVANRASWAAWLGAAGWADLDADKRRLHLTPQSLRLLLAKQGTEVVKVSTPFSGRSYLSMLQTMINAFTLRNNVFRHLRAGTAKPQTTRQRLAIALDTIVSVLVAIPLSVVALIVEGVASVSKRGAVMRVRTAPTAAAADPTP